MIIIIIIYDAHKKYTLNLTSSSAIAERPCDCCVGQIWPKAEEDSADLRSIFNHCDVIGFQSYLSRAELVPRLQKGFFGLVYWSTCDRLRVITMTVVIHYTYIYTIIYTKHRYLRRRPFAFVSDHRRRDLCLQGSILVIRFLV